MKLTALIIIRTLITRFLLGILFSIYAIPIIIWMLLPDKWRYDSKFFNTIGYYLYVVGLKLTFIPFTYRGGEVPHEPSIVIGNHQSALDIAILGSVMGNFPHVYLAKEELMDSWVLRFVLPRMAVLVDQRSPQKAMRSLMRILALAKGKRRHVALFPEGGRFTDGKIHDFFKGFVILARKLERPVIPVYIHDAYRAYSPQQFWVYPVPVDITVGPAFMIAPEETDQVFCDRVRQWFLEQQAKTNPTTPRLR